METLFFALLIIVTSGLLIWSMHSRRKTRKNLRLVGVEFIYKGMVCIVKVRILRMWHFVFVGLSVVPKNSPVITCELFKNGKKMALMPNLLGKYNSIGFANKKKILDANIKLDDNIIFEIPLV